jgi:hypothetical protein
MVISRSAASARSAGFAESEIAHGRDSGGPGGGRSGSQAEGFRGGPEASQASNWRAGDSRLAGLAGSITQQWPLGLADLNSCRTCSHTGEPTACLQSPTKYRGSRLSGSSYNSEGQQG